jgi:hypothetical protein
VGRGTGRGRGEANEVEDQRIRERIVCRIEIAILWNDSWNTTNNTQYTTLNPWRGKYHLGLNGRGEGRKTSRPILEQNIVWWDCVRSVVEGTWLNFIWKFANRSDAATNITFPPFISSSTWTWKRVGDREGQKIHKKKNNELIWKESEGSFSML